ncbi:MAG: binding-protein-dependent transport system inner rane component [Chloroflexi bacterium]|jgi:peptide/nickel transport system permease protein|nr:binding-protein-dependent transport system inner rane component [Chloroflexota bacterium]MDB5074029.1 binding-protein-dependent transport system inner rane component [Chloroflexota bacterium]
MTTFLVRRLGFLVLVILGVSIITFVVSHVVPADPVALLAGKEATADKIAQIRHTYGLDQSLPQQYLTYIGKLLHGDLGLSSYSRRPVLDDFRDYFPATVELTLYALVICLLVGVPLGVYSGLRRGAWVDHATRVFSVAGTAMPLFWLGLLLQLLFYGKLGWLPESGRLDTFQSAPKHITGIYTLDSVLTLNIHGLLNTLKHVLLPACCLAFASLSLVVRVTRSSMVDVITQDYIRTARAKGLHRRTVVMRHAMRNALIPTTTLLGLQVGNLLGGTFLVETVFSWPGIGFYSVNTIQNFDYQAIMSITVILAITYTLVNLLVDVLYTKLDPRLQLA